MDFDQRLARLERNLQKSLTLNYRASMDETSRTHHMKQAKETENGIFDVPMFLLRKENYQETGPSCDDHLNDPDVSAQLKDIQNVNLSVYDDYSQRKTQRPSVGKPVNFTPKQEVLEEISNRLNKKKEKMKKRNQRAADIDISGKYQVDFINDKNKRFNKKLAREYNQYTQDLRVNIERGGNI